MKFHTSMNHLWIWSLSTAAATLFNDEDALSRSDSEWAEETKSLIPTGRGHLSRVDLFETTTNMDSSFKACKRLQLGDWKYRAIHQPQDSTKMKQRNGVLTRSAMSSRSWRSVFIEPVDFSRRRKTMGDSGLLATESPCISDSPVFFLQQVPEPEMALSVIQ